MKWRAAGHDVVYGARKGDGEGPGGAPLMPIGDAIDGAGVVVFAIPGGAVAETITPHGPVLSGRIVLDATNNMSGPVPDARAAITAAVAGRPVRARVQHAGLGDFADPVPGAALFFAAEPSARETSEELIRAVGLARPTSGTRTPPASWTPCSRCGSHWSSRTAATAGSP